MIKGTKQEYKKNITHKTKATFNHIQYTAVYVYYTQCIDAKAKHKQHTQKKNKEQK